MLHYFVMLCIDNARDRHVIVEYLFKTMHSIPTTYVFPSISFVLQYSIELLLNVSDKGKLKKKKGVVEANKD